MKVNRPVRMWCHKGKVPSYVDISTDPADKSWQCPDCGTTRTAYEWVVDDYNHEKS